MNDARRYRERMRKLKKLLLERAKAKEGPRFLMSSYGFHQGEHEPQEQNYCGTSACVLGLAALSTTFRDLIPQWKKDGDCWLMGVRLKGEDVQDDTAGRIYFGLTYHEAHMLFLDFSIKTEREAAERVQEILDGKHIV